jgi:hypothetical protein
VDTENDHDKFLMKGGLKMKKSLLVMLLAMLSFFMFVGISQAGQCIYLSSGFYYDSSGVKHSGDIVSYVIYATNTCEKDNTGIDVEIDCARRMERDYYSRWTEWQSFSPGSDGDVAWQKLCR